MQDGVRKRWREQGFAWRGLLVGVNVGLVALLCLGLAGVTRRVVTGEVEKDGIADELARTRVRLERLTTDSENRVRELIVVASDTRRRESDVTRDWDRALNAFGERLASLESSNLTSRLETVSTLHREMEDLRSSLQVEIGERRPVEHFFREFEERHRGGVVLIYTEFDYCKVRDGKEGKCKTVSGWGSGFFITDEGHVVTNKHVIQPWKFDPDLATMIALGEIRVDEDSLRIAAWPSGTQAFDDDGKPNLTRGFNNTKSRNLAVFAFAADHMSERDLDVGMDIPKFAVHELDDNDLVILKAEGSGFDPLPCATLRTVDDMPKLSPIMALGFPRGQSGLELGRVESSPSIGTVRKVENTIHVTASIIPGNSGGPLIGPSGEVVGVVTRIYSETLGICLKVERALALLEAGREAEKLAREAAKALRCLPVK